VVGVLKRTTLPVSVVLARGLRVVAGAKAVLASIPAVGLIVVVEVGPGGTLGMVAQGDLGLRGLVPVEVVGVVGVVLELHTPGVE
jgi:hypothetical protein